ncbi:hypothetical protein [Gorillibacterium timonense]|uniref:hypothetical protein n=1 Tax=Gorillibacterium timonense TaxID=1689269 RepID=UPI00071C9A4E|nr:hypothetical protein [Gorillibacterium timonense]
MKKLSTLLLVLCLILIVCKIESKPESVDTALYNGNSLFIGVVGDPPLVREPNIHFKKMSLDQMEELAPSSGLDAVFIMKDHFREAAGPQYAKVYQHAGIPFFYIDTHKTYIPFVNEDLAYEDVPDLSMEYAVGYYQSGVKYQGWGFGLYNDIENEANIRDVYTRIFTTIESVHDSGPI